MKSTIRVGSGAGTSDDRMVPALGPAQRGDLVFECLAEGPVTRHEVRNLKAFNFVIGNAPGGGVTISLARDIHGKSLSNVMLAIELPARAREENGT